MSQENNGSPEFVAKDKLKYVEKLIEEYEKQKGFVKLQARSDAELYINMPAAEMRKLDAESADEASVLLTSYAAFIQQSYNLELSRVNWATAEITKVVSQEAKQYRANSFEERKTLAIMGNDYASKLNDIRTWAQALVDRLSFMATRIESIAKAYSGLAHSKRQRNYGKN